MKHSFLIKLIIAVIINIFILGVFEVSLRLFFHGKTNDAEPTDFIKKFGNKWIREAVSGDTSGRFIFDPLLFWKNRPGIKYTTVQFGRNFREKHASYFFSTIYSINNLGFLGKHDVRKNKDQGETRILSLGDSSTFGWSLESTDSTYSAQLEKILESESTGGANKFSVLNAAVLGYTSQQGYLYLKESGESLEPDIVVVYFGNNDGALHTALSDREMLEQAPWSKQMAGVRSLLNRVKIYCFLRGLLLPARENLVKGTAPKIRVSPEEYRENLSSLIEKAAQFHSRVILVDVPVPLDWPPYFFPPQVESRTQELQNYLDAAAQKGVPVEFFGAKTFNGRCYFSLIGKWNVINGVQGYDGSRNGTAMDYVLEGYVREGEGDIEGAMDIYSRGLGNYPDEPALLNNFGVTCWNAGQKQRAVSILQKLVSIEPEFAIGRFNLGTAFTGTGELDAGIGELKAARELDRMVLRIKEPYREILKSLSRQYNVPLVNAHEKFEHLFLERGSDGFLFNDFCHPSSTGHKIIAEMIKAQIH